MRLFIPNIGTKIQLTTPWKFLLNYEHRNRAMWETFGFPAENYWQNQSREMILPINTILTVDRIYIKKGAPDYASITFTIHHGLNPHLPRGRKRFWVSLDNANKIECEILPELRK